MTSIEPESIKRDFQPVPSQWDSTAYSIDRNDAPNTHGAPEARERAMRGFKKAGDLVLAAANEAGEAKLLDHQLEKGEETNG